MTLEDALREAGPGATLVLHPQDYAALLAECSVEQGTRAPGRPGLMLRKDDCGVLELGHVLVVAPVTCTQAWGEGWGAER